MFQYVFETELLTRKLVTTFFDLEFLYVERIGLLPAGGTKYFPLNNFFHPRAVNTEILQNYRTSYYFSRAK